MKKINERLMLFYGSALSFGGWNDFVGFFDTKGDAISYVLEHYIECDPYQWVHIVFEGEIILEGHTYPKGKKYKPKWHFMEIT